MQSGKLKSEEVMTDDNVTGGIGAMRAFALQGVAKIDIDHYEDKLPDIYQEKYGLENGTVGTIIDAEAVKDDGKVNGEFIAMLDDKKTYDLVKAGKFKGCSVVDYVRNLKCDEECEYEGSAYMNNTLILEEVPNSNGTWVSAVTEEDIGTVITIPDKQSHAARKIIPIIQERLKKKHEEEPEPEPENPMTKYKKDDKWKDGGVAEYLTEERGMPKELATRVGKVMSQYPDILNDYQIGYLSESDLNAWMDNVIKIQTLEKQVRHGIRYGQEQVNYTEAGEDPETCKNCRWFAPVAADVPEGPGACDIVSDEIEGVGYCDEFAMKPGRSVDEEPPEDEPEEVPEGEEPLEEPPMEEPEMAKPVVDIKTARMEARMKAALDERNQCQVELNNMAARFAVNDSAKRTMKKIHLRNRIAELDKILKKNMRK